ncbi:hypothetical protein TNCV_454541 [Trichonephila clavipes]|nr:hypothetical protein TNCV_454541 [Trichonephila clavipes]
MLLQKASVGVALHGRSNTCVLRHTIPPVGKSFTRREWEESTYAGDVDVVKIIFKYADIPWFHLYWIPDTVFSNVKLLAIHYMFVFALPIRN